MCVTDVGRVVAIGDDGATASIETRGRARQVSLAVLVLEGTPVGVGDWVVLHTGLAVRLVDGAEAEELLALTAPTGPADP